METGQTMENRPVVHLNAHKLVLPLEGAKQQWQRGFAFNGFKLGIAGPSITARSGAWRHK